MSSNDSDFLIERPKFDFAGLQKDFHDIVKMLEVVNEQLLMIERVIGYLERAGKNIAFRSGQDEITRFKNFYERSNQENNQCMKKLFAKKQQWEFFTLEQQGIDISREQEQLINEKKKLELKNELEFYSKQNSISNISVETSNAEQLIKNNKLKIEKFFERMKKQERQTAAQKLEIDLGDQITKHRKESDSTKDNLQIDTEKTKLLNIQLELKKIIKDMKTANDEIVKQKIIPENSEEIFVPTEFIEIGAIKIHEVIGKGAFGRVYSGTWEKKGEVAIKTINQVGDAIEKEAVLLSHLEHPNIVQLYGMTRKDGNLLLVFELMNLGDLRKYLKDRKPANAGSYSQFPPPLTTMELKKIIVDILKGLSYLQKQPVVHRDLAARNCLVAGDTDVRSMSAAQRPPTVVKIADFGMSKLLKGKEYYLVEQEGLLPIRWMPPESVNDFRFTIMSDIWSLGVTMWEVMNYGDLPFGEDIPSALAINYAVHGMPPPKTSNLSDELYALMRRCWELVPEDRIPVDDILLDPQFETIVSSRPAETVSISTDPLLPLSSDE